MNDEIKIRHELNILSNTILDDTTYKPTISRRKLLLDYITNLQQIEQDHKETNATLMSELAKLEEENERLKNHIQNIPYRKVVREKEDYNSRCEKAIEYLKSYNTDFEHCRFNEAPISLRELGDLLNILQNGSDNSEIKKD